MAGYTVRIDANRPGVYRWLINMERLERRSRWGLIAFPGLTRAYECPVGKANIDIGGASQILTCGMVGRDQAWIPAVRGSNVSIGYPRLVSVPVPHYNGIPCVEVSLKYKMPEFPVAGHVSVGSVAVHVYHCAGATR